ncbi:adenylyl-sulfate kinase [Maridesulfovibrio hydrothermalis]|uniref:Adenylylsulfate kinase and related kinase-like protein n=1 Tax=Maridesulfovibrio hydrothermalis AM13 = DSM 14728 TaxID=1121451 RepID=L0RF96_9BACT|nr:adenylyl-sulfate kinase [Maridesulfovibrio hydrothermalis]CCO24887.1 Adenylylsulfate kinase and related kinase-like protein [Maridesulfovibrio hydrothermalis AM13 = DSM 14728]
MPDLKGICVNKNWAVWITGLPGCGKSTIAAKLYERLREDGLKVMKLCMDERRKFYISNPEYTCQERSRAYNLFVEDAVSVMESGRCVIMDGTAHEKCWRNDAREKIEYFAEIYLRCPVNMAMKREAGRQQGLVMAGLYEKALERQRSGREFKDLGEVIGVDVKFQEDKNAECIVDTTDKTPDEILEVVMDCLQNWRKMNGIC